MFYEVAYDYLPSGFLHQHSALPLDYGKNFVAHVDTGLVTMAYAPNKRLDRDAKASIATFGEKRVDPPANFVSQKTDPFLHTEV